MIWLHLYRPAPAALVRCYGSGLLTVYCRDPHDFARRD